MPNISFGTPVMEVFKKHARKTLDVHLMIIEPEKYVADFAKAGADHIYVQVEACPHLHRNLAQINVRAIQLTRMLQTQRVRRVPNLFQFCLP